MLLSREEFSRQVFERDNHKCVVCGVPAKDAHHLIERSLWTEESEKHGYFLNNGVSLCEEHHILAERSIIPPQAFRRMLNIPKIKPKSFEDFPDYSKWGEQFTMPPRCLAKYPSTSYLDVSPNCSGNNDVIPVANFADFPVVITIKMDGSNVVLRRHSMGARNGQTAHHPSFDALKSIHAGIKYNIPESVEIFGEWLYAKHSIHYSGSLALKSYLQIFAIYDMKWRVWLSWDATESLAKALGFSMVPVLCTATYKDWQVTDCVCRLGTEVIEKGHEGIVIRSRHAFHYGQFPKFVGKFVRDNHVQTDDHWKHQAVVKNEINPA